MEKPAIPNPPEKPRRERGTPSAERKRAWRAEAAGIILIALAILVYTVLRYGAHVNWSAR